MTNQRVSDSGLQVRFKPVKIYADDGSNFGFFCHIQWCKYVNSYALGPGSVVGIATSYGLNRPGIESRWGRDFPHLSKPALGPTQVTVQWVPDLSRGTERPGRDADPSPTSSAVVKKGYSPYGPYGLYRILVPVQGCTLPFSFFTTYP
jgi:hypothetical protein